MNIVGRDYRVDRALHDVDIMLHLRTCYSYRAHRNSGYWLNERFRSVEQAESRFPDLIVLTHNNRGCLQGQGTHLQH